jgi:hypothetical protein
MPWDSTQKVQAAGSPLSYYTEYVGVTNAYVEKTFGGNAHTITVSNDSSSDPIQLSWDGATLKCELKPNETITLGTAGHVSIWVKGTAGGGNARIWAT